MSINKSMSSNKKLLSLVKLVKLFVSCIQNATLQKIFALNPTGGLNAPPPPDPHLQSTSIHRWLRPCTIVDLWAWLTVLLPRQNSRCRCGFFLPAVPD